ncbi:hypothetical protein CYLTODRAFT_490782 [Cylindrobasidium torrendii FP15055 ss-10]|uniref:Chitin synthase export chaperone n=1 Tax=Cylindrobasidium torrendii FP15055 ss-10 TaxID=1314674 RepID=A0A0D7B9V5_9AGAR|nr:hypothetical protein CYLTODRAFT_490782 [Cylindrobasidium torrendii FP15055 ss-10]
MVLGDRNEVCDKERMFMVNGTLLYVLLFGVYTLISGKAAVAYFKTKRAAAAKSDALSSFLPSIPATSVLLMYSFSFVGFLTHWFTAAQTFGAYGADKRFPCEGGLGPQRWVLNAVDFELSLVLTTLLLAYGLWVSSPQSKKLAIFPIVLTVAQFGLIVAEFVVLPSTEGWNPGFTVYQSAGFAPLSNIFSVVVMSLGVIAALYTVMVSQKTIPITLLAAMSAQIAVSAVDKEYTGSVLAIALKFVLNVLPCLTLLKEAEEEGGAIQL